MATPQKPEEKEVTGLSISDPKDGTLFIGESVSKERTRQVELHSTSGAHLKLYKDGGFELSGEPNDGGDNIVSRSSKGLFIVQEGGGDPEDPGGIRIDAGSGVITLRAREIRYETSAADEPMVIRSAQNIVIEAQDSIRINAANVAIGARNKLLLASKGSIYMKGVGGVTIIEPKAALIPTNLSEFVDKIMSEVVFGGL